MTMNATNQNQRYALQELEKEALMGAEGEETFARGSALYRPVELCRKKNDIAEQLWEAVEIGFFQVQPSRYSAGGDPPGVAA